MANPLKILTVLTASEAAQFKKAVQVETGGLTVSAGDTNLQAVYATNLSASGTGQVGGNLTVAGDITLRDATLRNANLSGDANLQNAYLVNAYLTGSATFIDGVAFSTISSSIKTYVDARDTAVSGALKTYIDAQDTADAIAWAAADAALSGTLKTYVDARDNAISGALKSYVDAADGVLDARITSVSGAIKTYVDAQDSALSGAVSSSLAAEASARAAEDLTFLKLDGTRPMTGNLNASSVQVSASSLNVGGAAYVGGDLSVQGNLQVLGNIDAVNRTDLYVTDAVIMVASGAANAAAADGAGFEVDGADASIKYASSGDRWLANKNMEVSAAYFAGGEKLLEKANIGAAVGAKLAYSDYGYVGIANFVDGDGVLIAGKSIVGVEATNFTMRATSSFEKQATFQAQVGMDAALKLSGSAFTYIATPIVSNKYDVNDAIRALDVAVAAAVNAGSSDLNTLKSNYDALRQVVTGTLSSGTALLTLAGAQFAAGQIDNLALDVMIDADNTGYTNDLVAIKMFVDGAAVKVQIDAPAAASAKYRLIVVNEADGKL